MAHSEITTAFLGDTYSLRADWAQACGRIERSTEDGWEDTGYQVADYDGPDDAMRYELTQSVVASCDDPSGWETKIEASLEAIEHDNA